jgi:ferredoxin
MADRNQIHPHNAPGPFYADLTCIDCDTCRSIAPSIFSRDDDEGFTFVKQQPVTADEIALAREAMRHCPTESIGEEFQDNEFSC